MRNFAQRGFTLIEMVVSMAILAAALPVLYGIFVEALSRMHRDVHLGEATLLAQSLLARAGTEYLNLDQPLQGHWNEYEFQLTQELVAAPDGQRPLTQPIVHVAAKITWPGDSAVRSLVISGEKMWTGQNDPR